MFRRGRQSARTGPAALLRPFIGTDSAGRRDSAVWVYGCVGEAGPTPTHPHTHTLTQRLLPPRQHRVRQRLGEAVDLYVTESGGEKPLLAFLGGKGLTLLAGEEHL